MEWALLTTINQPFSLYLHCRGKSHSTFSPFLLLYSVSLFVPLLTLFFVLFLFLFSCSEPYFYLRGFQGLSDHHGYLIFSVVLGTDSPLCLLSGDCHLKSSVIYLLSLYFLPIFHLLSFTHSLYSSPCASPILKIYWYSHPSVSFSLRTHFLYIFFFITVARAP